MSGGHFDYNQYRITTIAETIDSLIWNNKSEEVNEWGDRIGNDYSEETIAEFEKAVYYLNLAYTYAQRIDWLVSGDDGEETFHRRLTDDLKNLEKYEILDNSEL